MLWMIIKLIPILLVLSFVGYGFIIYKETKKEESETEETPTETETETENTKEKED